VNVVDGRITHPGVADAFGMEALPLERFLREPARA